MTLFNVKMSKDEELAAAFGHFDVDGDGKVGAPEILQVRRIENCLHYFYSTGFP